MMFMLLAGSKKLSLSNLHVTSPSFAKFNNTYALMTMGTILFGHMKVVLFTVISFLDR